MLQPIQSLWLLWPFLMQPGKPEPRPDLFSSCCDRFKVVKPSIVGQPSAPTSSNAINIQPGSFSASAKAELAAKRQTRTAREPDANLGEDPVPIMRNRLRNCLDFWKTFCKSTLVLSWIAHGFDLRWRPEVGTPQSAYFPNHQTTFQNSVFVSSSIAKLVQAGVMVQVIAIPWLVLPLGVVFKKSNGKPRLFFDGRYLNDHIIIPSFKYEDLGACSRLIQPGDYMVTTDYTSGYHHVDIRQEFWTYLGVEWQGSYYVYTSLPFGLASACWAFTKITNELLHKWRRSGHRCSGYLDDAIHLNQNPLQLERFIHTTLIPETKSSGFLMNMIKSNLVPQTKSAYLGVFVDSIRGCYEIPPTKRAIILSLINQALAASHKCPIRLLEILTGNLASMHWAFGPLSRLMTMSVYADIKRASSRWGHVALSDTSIQDLNFWLCGFDAYNGFKPLWEPTGFHTTIFTDAAGLNLKNYGGWAGWTDSGHGRRLIAKGTWAGDIILDHSTTQELFAVHNTILSFNRNHELSGKRILIKTDNQAVFFIINKAGSRDSHVHELCKSLIWYCIHHRITIAAHWIPRDENTFADYYSKLTDSGDWKLDTRVFNVLSQLWGPFDIDLFASYENHQTSQYYSRYFTPTCTGVDAFSHNWGQEFFGTCWCNPPFGLVGQALSTAQHFKARMCLLCPFTPSAAWWPLLSPDGLVFNTFVLASRVLYRRPNLFLPGHMAHSYTNRVPRWHSLALLIDFLHTSPTAQVIPAI